MSRFVTGRLQSAVRSIISYSSRQIHSMMDVAGVSRETDIQDDSEQESDTDYPCPISDPDEPDSDAVQLNGNSDSVTVIEANTPDDVGNALESGSPHRRQEVSGGSGSRMSTLHDHLRPGFLFPRLQLPKREFHVGSLGSSNEGYSTRGQVVRIEKGECNSDFNSVKTLHCI